MPVQPSHDHSVEKGSRRRRRRFRHEMPRIEMTRGRMSHAHRLCDYVLSFATEFCDRNEAVRVARSSWLAVLRFDGIDRVIEFFDDVSAYAPPPRD
jgi:hypothetical protein